MSNDTITETTTKGWGSRIKGALTGLILGPLLIIGSMCLLWWNEGRTIRTAKALTQGKNNVITVSADSVSPANEGKLIYLTGKATTEETLQDPEFGVEETVLVLRRKTEMYQWHEEKESTTEKNLGGSETTKTTYKYHKDWSNRIIDSSDFKERQGHSNPAEFVYPATTWIAENATVGAFRLTETVINEIGAEQKLSITEAAEDEDGEPIGILVNGAYFLGNDPKNPAIGDERVSFTTVPPTEISVVAAQTGEALSNYVSDNGTSITLVKAGIRSVDELFAAAQSENSLIAWLVRLGGVILAIIGFAVFMSLLSVLGDVVPFIGTLIGFGTGLIALVLGASVAALTIAVAWLAYRPLISGILILGIIALMFVLFRRKAKTA